MGNNGLVFVSFVKIMDSYFLYLTSCNSFIHSLCLCYGSDLFLASEVSMTPPGAPLTIMTMWTQFGE